MLDNALNLLEENYKIEPESTLALLTVLIAHRLLKAQNAEEGLDMVTQELKKCFYRAKEDKAKE